MSKLLPMATAMTTARTVLRNGAVIRAVLLAAATLTLLICGFRLWVPIAVSAYTILNAYALTRATVRDTPRTREIGSIPTTFEHTNSAHPDLVGATSEH